MGSLPGGGPSLLPRAEGPLKGPQDPSSGMKNFMIERETNRAEQKNQQGLIRVSGLSDKIPPGESVERAGSHWGYLVYKRNPARVTELLASECNRAFTATVDRPLQEM